MRHSSAFYGLLVAALFFLNFQVSAQDTLPNKKLVTSSIIQEIKNFVDTDIVRLSIKNQNTKIFPEQKYWN